MALIKFGAYQLKELSQGDVFYYSWDKFRIPHQIVQHLKTNSKVIVKVFNMAKSNKEVTNMARVCYLHSK